MYGKYPHPSTLVPGGVMTTLSTSTFNEFYTRLMKYVDYSKKLVGIWDDVVDFFYAQDPDYARVGERPINLIQTGIWDDPEAYDANSRTPGAKYRAPLPSSMRRRRRGHGSAPGR